MLGEWLGIQSAADSTSINVRRADPDHPLDFRIGRDFRGRYIFQLEAIARADDDRSLPAPAGIEVARDPVDEERVRLTLTLGDSADFDIFRVLCADLLAVTENLSPADSERGMSTVLYRLVRWQDVLARRRAGALNRNEIMGLTGELLFLRDLLVPKVNPGAAVGAWRGPFGDEQDFVLSDTIFEVKTQSSTADRRLQISSEDQLDTSRSRIILCQQGIAPSIDRDPAGRTLNALVAELRGLLNSGGSQVIDRLDLALFEAGWEQRAEYDQDVWQLVDRIFYEVRDGFPRIIRTDLRPGVEEVRYRIRVADCAPFRVEVESTMEELTADGP